MRDVVIIGAGPAGLSAALVLGRFRHAVTVLDAGHPRNERSHAVHSFFSRDGIPPSDLLQISREQLEPYSTVTYRQGEAVDVKRHDAHFEVRLSDGELIETKYLLFATGVRDVLPEIEGVGERWGRRVFHCPYCHGWEVRDKAVAILANGAGAVHMGKLLHSLSRDLTICTNGAAEIDAADAAALAGAGIAMIETPIAAVREAGDEQIELQFADGQVLRRDAAFVRSSQEQRSMLPEKLGCARTQAGLLQVDEWGETSVGRVYAAGDMASPLQQVIYAAARGAAAGTGINTRLSQEQFEMG